MFGWFKRAPGEVIPERSLSAIRSDTRALIRIANEFDAADPATGPPAGTAEHLALASAESRLAGSISGAISSRFGTRVIMHAVITPVIDEAIVVSDLARGAILRAVAHADRSEPKK